MEELVNQAKVEGFYQNQKIQITSNLSKTQMEKPLSIILNVDKTTWKTGALTYTVQIKNHTNQVFHNGILKIPIDTNVVNLLKESVKLNEEICPYTYENPNLCVSLKEISNETTLTFKVQAKEMDFFLLETTCLLVLPQEEIISSNPTKVLHPRKKKFPYSGCDLPYWRI